MSKKSGILAGKMVNDLELLQRHLTMLQFVSDNEPIGIIKLAELLELPQHKVRYSLRLLEQDGLIEATTAGARTTRKLAPFLRKLKAQLGTMNASMKDIQKSVDRLMRATGK